MPVNDIHDVPDYNCYIAFIEDETYSIGEDTIGPHNVRGRIGYLTWDDDKHWTVRSDDVTYYPHEIRMYAELPSLDGLTLGNGAVVPPNERAMYTHFPGGKYHGRKIDVILRHDREYIRDMCWRLYQEPTPYKELCPDARVSLRVTLALLLEDNGGYGGE